MPVRVVSTGLPLWRVEDSGTPLTEGIARASETLLSLGPRLAEIGLQKDRMQKQQALQEREIGIQQGRLDQENRNTERAAGLREREQAWREQNAQQENVRNMRQDALHNRLLQQQGWDKRDLNDARAEAARAKAELDRSKVPGVGTGILGLIGMGGKPMTDFEKARVQHWEDQNSILRDRDRERQLGDVYNEAVRAAEAERKAYKRPFSLDEAGNPVMGPDFDMYGAIQKHLQAAQERRGAQPLAPQPQAPQSRFNPQAAAGVTLPPAR